jgi:predicted aspartyl protease
MNPWSFGAIALLSLAAPLAAQGVPPAHTDEFQAEAGGDPPDGALAEELAFRKDDWARMTVPVHFSGRGPYRFMVDTGSDRTTISRQLAQQLRLPPGSPAILHSITSASQVQTAKIPGMELGTRTLWLSDAPLLEAANMGADGILGTDSLKSDRVLFDFTTETISILPGAKRLLPEEKGTIVVQGRRKNGRLILTRADADGVPLDLVVDTGAQISVGNEALRRALLARGQLRKLGQAELISVTGEKLVGDQLLIADLKVGGIAMRGLPIVFGDAHAFKPLGLAKRPALLLGMNAMRSFERVSIDFKRKRLRVLLPPQSKLDRFAMR